MLYHLSHLFARDLSERLLLAYYDTPLRDHHVTEARRYLLKLLSGPGNTPEEARSEVLDLIETEIAVNVTPRDQAEAVLAALLDSVAPMPEDKT